MQRCEQCGMESRWTFAISMDGTTHTFDSFECALFAMAPACNHCGCRILGHPALVDDELYCCTHCAEQRQQALQHAG